MRAPLVVLALVLGVVGAALAALLWPSTSVDVGPAVLEVSARPTASVAGGTTADLGSVGRAVLDTHDGPLEVRLAMREIHPDVMTAVITEDGGPDIPAFDEQALRSGATRHLLGLAAAAVAAGALLSFLVLRRRWAAGLGAAGAAASIVALGAVTWATFGLDSGRQVRFEGALSVAPAVLGDVEDRYEGFATQVGRLTTEFALLQQQIASGPGVGGDDGPIKVLVVADMHLNTAGVTMARHLAASYDVDLVVNLGDDTDWGTEPELDRIATRADFDVPYLWVRGNHDSPATQRAVAAGGGTVLDGETATVAGLTFYGIGDPTFTPEKSQEVIDLGEQEFKETWSEEELLPAYRAARQRARDAGTPIDVLLVHDETMAAAIPAAERPPLVLSGHRHRFRDVVADGSRSIWMGSTGGAGLRVFDSPEGANPNQVGIFYFDLSGEALAYDLFTFRPLDENRFEMQRVLLTDDAGTDPDADSEEVEDGEED